MSRTSRRSGRLARSKGRVRCCRMSTQTIGDGKKEKIKVKTDVKVYENEREAEVAMANAELAKKRAGWDREARVGEVEASKVAALQRPSYRREVERMNVMTKTEKLKANFLTSLQYETKVQEANWEISIWTDNGRQEHELSGGGGGGGYSAVKSVAGVYKMLPPLLNTIHE